MDGHHNAHSDTDQLGIANPHPDSVCDGNRNAIEYADEAPDGYQQSNHRSLRHTDCLSYGNRYADELPNRKRQSLVVTNSHGDCLTDTGIGDELPNRGSHIDHSS